MACPSSAPTDYQKGTYYFSLPLDSRTYYIQYNQCKEDPELPMETFTAQVMADLEQGSYSVLLLDLRNNGGGSDGVIIPLLMELAPLVRSGELELWGLVGEATFSSASINALEIREMGGGLAGEPTSGSVDHFGSTGSFTLPNTGVRVSMSTKFIDTGTLLECAAGLGVEPIQPDVTVYQTLEDYLAGQDTLVDALCARTEPFQPQERPDAPLSRGRLTELLRGGHVPSLPSGHPPGGSCHGLADRPAPGDGPLRHRRADGRRLHRLLGAGRRPMGGIRRRPGHSKRRLSSPGYPDPGGGGGPSLSSPLTLALLCHPCLSQSSTASPACAWKEASSRSSSSSRSPARYQT